MEALIVLDYYIQLLESKVFSKDEARNQAQSFLYKFREEMKKEEYLIVYEMITRLSNIQRGEKMNDYAIRAKCIIDDIESLRMDFIQSDDYEPDDLSDNSDYLSYAIDDLEEFCSSLAEG